MSAEFNGPSPCARCGRPLRPAHHFCPECGLPAAGAVLSTEIRAVSDQKRAQRTEHSALRRHLPLLAMVGMLAFVVVIGAILFDRELIGRFVPPAEADQRSRIDITGSWEPEWTLIPTGTFHAGEPFIPVYDEQLVGALADGDDVVAHHIRRFSITNRQWRDFLVDEEAELKAARAWYGQAFPLQRTGWHLDDAGLPEPNRLPGTGTPDWESLVSDVSLTAVRRFRAWWWDTWWNDPAPQIERLGISNGVWSEFLQHEWEALRDEGVLDICTPSRWIRENGAPPIPDYTVPDTGIPGSLEDEATLVSGLPITAIRRYYDWRQVRVNERYWISTYEIRNELWRDFLEHQEEALREAGLFDEAVPGARGSWKYKMGRWSPPADQLDRPVVNVSAGAAVKFAEWLTARLGRAGVRIRIPKADQWEYAARGHDRRVYPWGDTFLGVPALGTGDPRLRAGLNANQSGDVDHVEEDTSYFGVVGMGVNVSEWVYGPHGYELRGGSFADVHKRARNNCKVWEGRPLEAGLRFNHVGLRLVKEDVSSP